MKKRNDVSGMYAVYFEHTTVVVEATSVLEAKEKAVAMQKKRGAEFTVIGVAQV